MTTSYDTLITPQQLRTLMASGQPFMVFDCSFDLMNPPAGIAAWRESHIPGAVHADMDHALSTHGDDRASGGRHPLPTRETFAAWLRSVGFSNDMQAVAYDRNGTSYCGRLWWMLKWAGHERVAVLDGGLQAWQAEGGLVVAAGHEPAPAVGRFSLGAPLRQLVDAATVLSRLGQPGQTVVDARAPARFRGEVEPLDPVAGHIPGALNRPFTQNFGPDGRFKSADALRAEFDVLLAGRDPASLVHQCGSGVSATPNVLAMAIAGLAAPALFAGSWSEWCSDPSRPVAQG